MERLTVRNNEGIGVLKQPFECERCGDFQWSLPDLGNGSPTDRLAEYEDLEEQGKLLKLPCAVGDTVYRICPKCNDSHNGSCKNCAWENSCSNRGCTVYGVWKDGRYPMGECTIVPYKVSWNYIPNLLENIGKRVFLTREEAEAAATLKES